MSKFDDWKASLPAGQGYSAEEAFNAGMTEAARICVELGDRGMNWNGNDCAEAIEAARDEK